MFWARHYPVMLFPGVTLRDRDRRLAKQRGKGGGALVEGLVPNRVLFATASYGATLLRPRLPRRTAALGRALVRRAAHQRTRRPSCGGTRDAPRQPFPVRRGGRRRGSSPTLSGHGRCPSLRPAPRTSAQAAAAAYLDERGSSGTSPQACGHTSSTSSLTAATARRAQAAQPPRADPLLLPPAARPRRRAAAAAAAAGADRLAGSQARC